MNFQSKLNFLQAIKNYLKINLKEQIKSACVQVISRLWPFDPRKIRVSERMKGVSLISGADIVIALKRKF